MRANLFNVCKESVLGCTPLNVPCLPCLLIEENEGVNVACWVEGEATSGAAYHEGCWTKDGGEAMVFVAPLHLPQPPVASVELDESVDIGGGEQPVCRLRILGGLGWRVLCLGK